MLNPETRLYWFNARNTECDSEMTLIGILFGLAIYNNIIVDVHFPFVLYRKLRGKLGRFSDLEQLDPVSYCGGTSLYTLPEEKNLRRSLTNSETYPSPQLHMKPIGRLPILTM